MSFRQSVSLTLLLIAIGPIEVVSAQDEESVNPSAKDRLDDFFLNCDALTANACELVSGSVTNTDGKQVLTLDFVWFRAQNAESRKKSLSYIEGRSYSPLRGPDGAFLERKLVVGDDGFYGLGANPRLKNMDLTSGLPEGELEVFLEKQNRLTYSQYEFPEICPATLMAAINVNPKDGTLGKANSLFGRMKLLDEYSKESLLVGTWRLDGKDSPGWASARIMFDRKQGHMPIYVEWRMRDTSSKSDPNDPTSYDSLLNVTETKWSQVPHKGKKLWAPVRVVNKRVTAPAQEWVIEATWKHDVLQNQYFDVAKINGDRDDNPLAKLRRQMQNAADKAEREKAEKAGKTESGDKK